MTKKTNIKVNSVVSKIVKFILKFYLQKKFNVKTTISKEVSALEPPFVVLLNHQGFWDPFLASVFVKNPILFIASDAIFRSKFFGFIVPLLGGIPKTKAQSDIDALKNIFAIKEQGKCIGIFPEGQRTWNGSTLPIIKSTAKLIKILKLPVVTVVFKGGFYSHPRWSTFIRKGELEIKYNLLFNGNELGKMRPSEIHSQITNALAHDEVAYQEKKQTVFKGTHLAENIEQYLFVCPSCKSTKGFVSSKNSFKCSNCDKSWFISNKMKLHCKDDNCFFTNIREWDAWQCAYIENLLDTTYTDGDILFEDTNVVIHTGHKSDSLKFVSAGKLCLSSTNLIVYSVKNKIETILVNIPLQNVVGINVQNKEILDFYYNNKLYTINDPQRHFNAYKYWKIIDYLQHEKLNLKIPT